MKKSEHNDAKYQQAISMLKDNSIELAVKKLELLSKEGDGHADSVLGVLYEFGKGDFQADEQRAILHYERSINSVGSLQGWMGVGRVSLNGSAQCRDLKKAFESFSYVANNANYPQAWLALGELHANGWGSPKDFDKAADCFKKAIAAGNVHGYVGLARVLFKQRKFVLSLKYRMCAFFYAIRAMRVEPDGGDRLKKW